MRMSSRLLTDTHEVSREQGSYPILQSSKPSDWSPPLSVSASRLGRVDVTACIDGRAFAFEYSIVNEVVSTKHSRRA